MESSKNWLKYTVGIVTCLLIRFIPFRPPNVEPILATMMPFSKKYGIFSGFLFSFTSIALYDIFSGKIGSWTFVTAGVYGAIGFAAGIYFKNRESTAWNYAKFAIVGTIVYDIMTGLTIGPIFFHQSFMTALVGQIPFTTLHLIGNVGFAIIFSPLIYKFVIQNKKLEVGSIIKSFNTQQA